MLGAIQSNTGGWKKIAFGRGILGGGKWGYLLLLDLCPVEPGEVETQIQKRKVAFAKALRRLLREAVDGRVS